MYRSNILYSSLTNRSPLSHNLAQLTPSSSSKLKQSNWHSGMRQCVKGSLSSSSFINFWMEYKAWKSGSYFSACIIKINIRFLAVSYHIRYNLEKSSKMVHFLSLDLTQLGSCFTWFWHETACMEKAEPHWAMLPMGLLWKEARTAEPLLSDDATGSAV